MTRNRASILGCMVDQVDYVQAMDAVSTFIDKRQGAHIVTANAEIIYQAIQMPDYLEIINQAELVTPDGIGTVWAARHLGYCLRERVTGIDLISQICFQATRRGWSIYLLGAAPGVAERASVKMREAYPGLIISGTCDGFFQPEQEAEIIEAIKTAQPDILLVGMGAPRQETWINRHRDVLGVSVYMGVGGSFDVISGDKKRAPQWVIGLHLEWLFRLLMEPMRFKRQISRPLFMIKVIRERLNAVK